MTYHDRRRAAMQRTALEVKSDGEAGNPLDPALTKKLAEISAAFAEFKRKSDEAQAEIRKGFDDVIRRDEVKRIDDAMEKLVAEISAMKRLPKGGESDGAAAEEVKAFNIALASGAMAMGRAAETMSADAYDRYKSAFRTWLKSGTSALGADETKALTVGSDADGGFLVTPDVSGRMIEFIRETSPIRQIATVNTISTDKLAGAEDLGETDAGWVGETGARTATTTPTLGQWSVEAFEMYAAPLVSQKMLDDASTNVEQWVARKLADKFSRLENAAAIVGNGAQKWRGLTAYPVAVDSGAGVAWGSVGVVKTGANGAFAASNPIDNLYDLMGMVKQAYLANAVWLTRRSVITSMKKFKATTGEYLWAPPTASTPESFAGHAIVRAEDMPALATGSLSLGFGDFRAAYQIVDRTGVRILRDPFSSKPYVMFYATKRSGGGVVNFDAYKLLQFAA